MKALQLSFQILDAWVKSLISYHVQLSKVPNWKQDHHLLTEGTEGRIFWGDIFLVFMYLKKSSTFVFFLLSEVQDVFSKIGSMCLAMGRF